MIKKIWICLIVTLLFFTSIHRVTAGIPHLVFNFSQMNELDWAAPQDEWVSEVKPKIIGQILEMKNRLENKDGDIALSWSTLMEYMNFPMDEVDAESPYVIKTKRIFEITRELNLPVFIPLNGFQWWDQLPELYNWWDPDGTRTDPAFFARQKNPEEFKQRFIAGYNPDNKWNVEWQSWSTPMRLNYRNWGGGGFRLAPPPNLTKHSHTEQNYRQTLEQRFRAIIREITNQYEELKREEKQHLFAGISIGTEVSLNASITPTDEFLPYGYRSIQDHICPETEPNCGRGVLNTKQKIDNARQEVVQQYLSDLSRIAVNSGLPKKLIYTHVWGETDSSDPRFAPYAKAAVTLYANPGISLYSYAKNPLASNSWSKTLTDSKVGSWGAIEYSAGDNAIDWKNGLKNTFLDSQFPADLLVIYNWDEQKNKQSILAIKDFLKTKTEPVACPDNEIITITANYSSNPITLEWQRLSNNKKVELRIIHGFSVEKGGQELLYVLQPSTNKFKLPKLDTGTYSWFVQSEGCRTQRITSSPQIFTITPTVPKDPTPWWVKVYLNFET